MASVWSGYEAADEKEREEQRNLLHERFRGNFLNAVYKKPGRFKGEVYLVDRKDGQESYELPVAYGPDKEIVCCPEPLEFSALFKGRAGDTQKNRETMRALICGEQTYGNVEFRKFCLKEKPEGGIWFNSTKDGINLRPGILQEEKGHTYQPVVLGDQTVHGIVVGRTGSGKSVFLNNLIVNLLTEYAPWELDLYLADFKKVELSRYMSAGEAYHTPHLKTCAATSEIRYVITMLTHLVECMQARQDLFTCLGIQKLSDFREKYGVVLPRIVLLVDEFQQMFQEATQREKSVIDDLLLSIIKLGRATGFHLLFASQEMKGALTGKALANFKIRFALPCDSSVSSEILGNSAAATLERGYVLVNMEAGQEEANKKYRVPFIKDDEEEIKDSYFYGILKALVKQEERYGYKKRKTFYQEDEQEKIDGLERLLSDKKVVSKKKKELDQKAGQYYDIFTLGHGVVYSEKKYDLETFYIERGRNRNVLAVCPDVDDLAYVQKLMAINMKASPYAVGRRHFYYDLHPVLSEKYHIEDDLGETVQKFYNRDTFEQISIEYYMRQSVKESCGEPDVISFLNSYADKMNAYTKNKGFLKIKEQAEPAFGQVKEKDLLERCGELEKANSGTVGITIPVKLYYMCRHSYPGKKTDNIPWWNIFEMRNYWISGIDYIEKAPKRFSQALQNGMSVNMFFLMFCSSQETNIRDYVSGSEYLFASGNIEKIYRNCGMSFTKKGRNSIVIDFKIKSLNVERAFKKYKIEEMEYEAPALDFDAILSGKAEPKEAGPDIQASGKEDPEGIETDPKKERAAVRKEPEAVPQKEKTVVREEPEVASKKEKAAVREEPKKRSQKERRSDRASDQKKHKRVIALEDMLYIGTKKDDIDISRFQLPHSFQSGIGSIKNGNVLVAHPDPETLVHIQKLLAKANGTGNGHYYYDLSSGMYKKYGMDRNVDFQKSYDKMDALKAIFLERDIRKAVAITCEQADIVWFFKRFADKLIQYTGNKDFGKIEELSSRMFAGTNTEQIMERCEELRKKYGDQISFLTTLAEYYYKGHYYYPSVLGIKPVPWQGIFEAKYYWINGIEAMEDAFRKKERTFGEKFFGILRFGREYNLFFYLFTVSDQIYFADYLRPSDYLFVDGSIIKKTKKMFIGGKVAGTYHAEHMGLTDEGNNLLLYNIR